MRFIAIPPMPKRDGFPSSVRNDHAEDSHMAYIVVVHMSPKQPSLLPSLLQKVSRIPVLIARDGQSLEPDHAYVVPPDTEITVFKGKVQLLDLLSKRATLPIDLFLRSLAQDQGRNAAAIIWFSILRSIKAFSIREPLRQRTSSWGG